jgi:hypothetical protein
VNSFLFISNNLIIKKTEKLFFQLVDRQLRNCELVTSQLVPPMKVGNWSFAGSLKIDTYPTQSHMVHLMTDNIGSQIAYHLTIHVTISFYLIMYL